MLTFNRIGIINIFLLIIIILFGVHPWHFFMLSVAQLLFVPLTLQMILKDEVHWFAKYLPYIGVPAFLSVVILQLTSETMWDPVLAMIYFAFTMMIAFYGFTRFFTRGFAHLEEFLIDIGLIYLAIGGAWFVAFEANIDVGFSPIITWLTGIHFHYSAFLLPIFVGLLGRINKGASFKWVATLVVLSPIIVALGVTFSLGLELVSVLIYIIGIYSLIHLSFKAPIHNLFQKWFVRISFASLGITIVFSLLYAFGNLTGIFIITIDFMLRFHGIINMGLFALLGVIGWRIHPPSPKYLGYNFPISRIRGKKIIGEKTLSGKTDDQIYKGLVDNMAVYNTLSPTISDFYENTNEYRLFAKVNWSTWFKPFAIIYRMMSRFVKQLNLPFSSRQVEMTGSILSVKDSIDGRSDVRAWVRKIDEEQVFTALYSAHQTNDRTYMNIALPLPSSTMIGILELKQIGKSLRLTSEKNAENSDSGIYLAIGRNVFKLPLAEQFDVEEVSEGNLKARHKMWIFSLPFLTIDYVIKCRSGDYK